MLKVKVLQGAMSSLICRLFTMNGYEITNEIEEADLLVFSGGEDIDPFIYDTATHKTTHSNWNKDQREITAYHQALELGIPCIGICRGAQLLHALNGGELWQNVNNHGRDHMAKTFGTNIPVLVSSIHHQMLRPHNNSEYILLLTANVATTKETMSKTDKPTGIDKDNKPYQITRYVSEAYPDDDIEALFYPETNCLCFQPHPELYAGGLEEKYKPMVDLFFSYVNQYSLDKDETKEESAA